MTDIVTRLTEQIFLSRAEDLNALLSSTKNAEPAYIRGRKDELALLAELLLGETFAERL